MSFPIFSVLSALALSVTLTAFYLSRFLALGVAAGTAPASREGRYRPMLRLLSEEDYAVVGGNKRLLRRLRAERSVIFRGYVRCLTLDYGRILAGLRHAAFHSAVDRPDLAWTVLQNRIAFTNLLFRLDILLIMHQFGVRGVNVSGLLEAMEGLRARATASLSSSSPIALAAA
jgi:hypothetical protein